MDPLVKAHGLKKHFLDRTARGRPRLLKAVDGVSLAIGRGETLGVVGESGSGKTTLAKVLMRLYAPTDGDVWCDGLNVTRLSGRGLRAFRKKAQMVFQDPYESLNPRFTVGFTVGEPLVIHGMGSARARRAAVHRVLEDVGLVPADDYYSRFPHQLSGGQRQRVAIARALIVEPVFLVADEPVSMLDVSIRAGLLNLLKRKIAEMGLAGLYISHDLTLIRHLCDRTLVMYYGRVVESGPTEALVARPRHPYTRMLLAAVPDPDPDRRMTAAGEIVDLGEGGYNVREGCAFAPRCAEARDLCRRARPDPVDVGAGHRVACHLAAESTTEGGRDKCPD